MIQESMRQSMWVAYNISKYQSLGFTINYSSVVSALGNGGSVIYSHSVNKLLG